MIKIYMFAAVVVAVCGAWFGGLMVGNAKCRAQIAQQNLQNLQYLQNKITKTKKENHENVYKTGVRDVRRILCDKYSIAE